MDDSGRLQRAVSFFQDKPSEWTNAQEKEKTKQMKMESCGGSLHDDLLSRGVEDGWANGAMPTRKRNW